MMKPITATVKSQTDEDDLKGDDKKEADKNKEAARLWITGIEAVKRKLGVGLFTTCLQHHFSCVVQVMLRVHCSHGFPVIFL